MIYMCQLLEILRPFGAQNGGRDHLKLSFCHSEDPERSEGNEESKERSFAALRMT